MAKLNSVQQFWIVDQLAMFRGPSEVAKSFTEEFGGKIDRSQVSKYDPTTADGARQLAQKFIERFYATRDAFTKEVIPIAVAHRSWRLNELMDLYALAKGKGELEIAARFLAQAAKEVGDVFSNIHRVKHSGTVGQISIEATPDQARNMLADRLILAIEDHTKGREAKAA